jgi:hypothetical protein
MTATAPTATICAGPDCTTSMEGQPATARYAVSSAGRPHTATGSGPSARRRSARRR